MHPGWMSQAHSNVQNSTVSVDGEQWPRRGPNPLLPSGVESRVLQSTSNVAINHIEHTDELPAGCPGDDETSDEEMESVHPRYGSVNVSGRCSEQEGRRSTTSNVTEPDIYVAGAEDALLSERMRSRLRYYFMNPLEKWEARRQFPYKLTLQLIKIFLVTLQIILFGSYRYASVNYTYDNRIAFSHLFLKDWDSGREITSYPPNMGPLAVYTKADFYDYVDFAVNAYFTVSNISIGPYHYHKNKEGKVFPLHMMVKEYVVATIEPGNDTYIFDTTTIEREIDIPIMEEPFSSRIFLAEHNFSINFITLLECDIKFHLRTIRFRDLGPLKSPDCFSFEIFISFLNSDHDGQVLVNLDSKPTKFLCKGHTKFTTNKAEKIGRSLLNYSVVIICALSLFLCCRAIYRAQQLKAESVLFFRKYFNKELTIHERLNFLNGWYILIIVNDILIIIGSTIKEEIENKELHTDAWNVCSTSLGIGNLLVWFGVLRYLGFFRTYNVLILTLKRASPNVLRFLICAILIYAGFTFCGWLILGPYHMKFNSLSTTSECLFALINGDDMFATFASMTNKSAFLWWFCRFYLYTFISLFIYVVLSLFIALIMDAYETIKLYYTEGFPRSALEEFIIGATDSNTSPNTSSYSSIQGSAAIGSHIHACHHYHPSVTKKISAGGMLDTILENICGCSTLPPQLPKDSVSLQVSIQSEETEPLVKAAFKANREL